MSNNAGNIAVGLVLNGADAFVGRVNKSAQSLDKYGNSAKTAGRNTENWLHQTRDAVIVLGLARSAVENLSFMLTSIPRAIIQQNAQLERSQVLIAGMDKNADSYADAMERARKTVSDLVNMSSSSPFSVQAIADSYAKLQAADIDKTAESMEALVNASAKAGTNSEGLKRASIAIQQMSGKGVISMEELRQQLGESIPTAMQLMANASGMKMGEMVKKISTGTMEAKSALRELFNEMAFTSMGAAEAMAQTIEGVNNRIRNDFTKLAKEVGDGGFSEEYKKIGNELDQMLNSGEAAAAARELGENLAYVTRVLFDMGVALADNSKLIGAVVAAMVGMKVLSGAQNRLMTFWNEADAAGKKYANNVERYTRRTEKLIEAHNNKIAANQERVLKRTQDYLHWNTQATGSQLSAYYKKHEDALNASHRASIERIRSAQQAYTSTSTRIISAAKGMFNAMGGWTTVVTAGITAAIYLLDEFIWKQQRAAEAIIRNQGLNTTVEQLTDAKKEAKSLTEEIERMEKARDRAAKKTNSSDYGSGLTVDYYENQIKLLTDKHKVLMTAIRNGTNELARVAREGGMNDAERLMYKEMNEISSVYKKGEEDLRKTLEEKGLKGEEFTKAFKSGIEQLREEAVASLEAAAALKRKEVEESMAQLKPNVKTGILSDADQEAMERYKGTLEGLNKTVDDYRTRVKAGDVESLSMSNAKLSAEDKLMDKLQLAEKLYVHRLARIKDEAKYGEYRIRLEEDIAAGKYKNSQIEIDALRKQADASDKAVAAYKAEQEEIAKKKKLLQEIDQVNKRLDSMLISMAKRLGTSQGKSLNSFMSWKTAAEQNSEAIAQMRKQLEEVNKGSLTKKQEDGLTQLALMAKQIDLNNIIAQQKEYQDTLEKSQLNQMQLYTRETNKTVSDLKEVKASLEAQLATMQMNTSEYWKTKDAIDAVNDSLDLAAKEAKRINPQTNAWSDFSRTIDDMSTQVDEQLVAALDGAMDGFVDSMWDASASFSETIDNMLVDIGKFITKLLIAQSIQKGMGMLMSADWGSSGAGAATSAQGTSVTGMSAVSSFANGGIMTELGSAPLRKYANGGVATSPQIALFGEGSQNEAYVPLPDGRTIPVTMMNENGSAPVVNVINQTGTQAEVEHTSSFDGERWVTDVVMKAASRPGKFRDAMRR